MARCAATARSSRNWRRRSSAPAGTSSRSSGARAGIRCWRAIPRGILQRVMEECVDGEYQNFKAKGGAYTREHFFGKDPVLKEMVANMSDEDIWRLNRGGHDALKVYAAYQAAVNTKGPPTVILAKTVKGFGLGKSRRRPDGRAPAEEARPGMRCASCAIASTSRCRMQDLDGSAVSQAGAGQRRDALPADAPQGARRLPAGAQADRPAADRAAAGGVPLDPGRHGGARDFHHHGVRAHTHGAAQGQGHRQAHRADRARTRRAPSAWKACSGRSASTPRSDSSIRRWTPRR